MVIHRVSPADFDQFIESPENSDRIFELIDGEIIEKVPSNVYVSIIAIQIATLIKIFLKESGLEGHVSGEAGGYEIGSERYAPDVAYLSKSKQQTVNHKGYNTVPPDLAVEVESETTGESERRLRTKIFNYLGVGTVVWVVYAETKDVEVYEQAQPIRKYRLGETLDGGEVLPGFKLAVKDIFEG